MKLRDFCIFLLSKLLFTSKELLNLTLVCSINARNFVLMLLLTLGHLVTKCLQVGQEFLLLVIKLLLELLNESTVLILQVLDVSAVLLVKLVQAVSIASILSCHLISLSIKVLNVAALIIGLFALNLLLTAHSIILHSFNSVLELLLSLTVSLVLSLKLLQVLLFYLSSMLLHLLDVITQ